MRTTRAFHGRISEHSHGIGAASLDSVLNRAREIALINGHLPNHFTDEDFLQAKRELMGADSLSESDDPTSELVRWDEPLDSHGHSVQKIEAPDEQAVIVELIEEGVNEAEHDQMVQGVKTHRL